MRFGRRNKVVTIVTAIAVVVGAAYAYWDLSIRVEQVQTAWLVTDRGEPNVVFMERRSGRYDHYMLETLGADGSSRGRTEVGSDRSGGVQVAGPVFGHFAWIRRDRELTLLDLLSHETAGSVPDVRLGSGPWVDTEGNAYVLDARGNETQVHQDLSSTPATASPKGRDEACRPALSAAAGLLNADIRGCIGTAALVQHSPTTARESWKASLLEPDGRSRWTVSLDRITEGEPAWLGHGTLVDDALWVVAVEPGWSYTLHVAELDAETGAIRSARAL